MSDQGDATPVNADETVDADPAGTASGETELRQELEQARARADEHFRSWQRSAADFANFKRRIDEDKKFAERWLIQELLPILDDFERAWAAAPRELRNLTWIEGVFQINSKLYTVLQRHGVSPIETDGKAFDPLEHEAVLHEHGETSDQTAVVAELQRGYRLHERVVRPALVKVGKPKPEPAAEAESP